MQYLLAVLALAAAAACGRASTAPAPCGLSASDSTMMKGEPLFRACGVDEPAKAQGSLNLSDWRPPLPPRSCYSATVEFVVDTNGVPDATTIRTIRANDGGYAEAILHAIPQMRYEPAKKHGMAVRQIVRLDQSAQMVTVVNGGGRLRGTAPPAHC